MLWWSSPADSGYLSRTRISRCCVSRAGAGRSFSLPLGGSVDTSDTTLRRLTGSPEGYEKRKPETFHPQTSHRLRNVGLPFRRGSYWNHPRILNPAQQVRDAEPYSTVGLTAVREDCALGFAVLDVVNDFESTAL